MTTQKTFHALISPLATQKKEVLDRGRLREYYEALHWYSERQIERAICRCIERCRCFPKVEEIKSEIEIP